MTDSATPLPDPSPQRVLLLGSTGTIGQATARALIADGHEVACLVREKAGPRGALTAEASARLFDGADVRVGDVTDPRSLREEGLRGERFDTVVSCLASRTGAPGDAWAIDHQAHLDILEAAKTAGVSRFVLLSAMCVQKPRLAFQHAKLAFERALIDSGLSYSIVRPTAYFKSLSGQIERLKRGKPFLIFGDGTLTACKPISDEDLARFLAGCLTDPDRQNRILPIGGPGAAITPREQGERLFALLQRPPKFKRVPVGMLDVISGALGAAGHIIPPLAEKAELARIGRYYATESMLVWDEAAGRYDADATPSFGTQTLFAYYERVINGEAAPELGDHAVF